MYNTGDSFSDILVNENVKVNTEKIVTKRNGDLESLDLNQIIKRIAGLCEGDKLKIDANNLVFSIVNSLTDKIETREIDKILANVCMNSGYANPDYLKLASRLLVNGIHKDVRHTFSECFHIVQEEKSKDGYYHYLPEIYDFVMKNAAVLDKAILDDNDYRYPAEGIEVLKTSYMKTIKRNGRQVLMDHPQYMLMRVAVHLYYSADPVYCRGKSNLEMVIEEYRRLSDFQYTYATPTLINACTTHSQLQSCFLMQIGDSIDEIYKTLGDAATISKYAGGIGLKVNVREMGSYIRGTDSDSVGIAPMLRVFDISSTYVNQGRRRGSYAAYLDVFHPDVELFLELRRKDGSSVDHLKSQELFYGLLINNTFVKKLKAALIKSGRALGKMKQMKAKDIKKYGDGFWYLISYKDHPELYRFTGDFEEKYFDLIKRGEYVKKIDIIKFNAKIQEYRIKNGMPYICNIENAVNYSNQKNLITDHGLEMAFNLCTEITEAVGPDEIATCCLASINLARFVGAKRQDPSTYDFEACGRAAYNITYGLNINLDKNNYPLPAAKRSASRHRSIGGGVQGTNEVFNYYLLPYLSDEARELELKIMECVYYNMARASADLAKKFGRSYETFAGSAFSKGILDPDLYGDTKFTNLYTAAEWQDLRDAVKRGMFNSLLTALMPTSTTSLLLGNTESRFARTSHTESRKILSGDIMMVTSMLQRDLIRSKLWNKEIESRLLAEGGSIATIEEIPASLRSIYKTSFELDQFGMMMALAEIQRFVSQAVSHNIYVTDYKIIEQESDDIDGEITFIKQKYDPIAELTELMICGSELGIKTLSYYTKTKEKNDARDNVNNWKSAKIVTTAETPAVCTNKENCLSCGA